MLSQGLAAQPSAEEVFVLRSVRVGVEHELQVPGPGAVLQRECYEHTLRQVVNLGPLEPPLEEGDEFDRCHPFARKNVGECRDELTPARGFAALDMPQGVSKPLFEGTWIIGAVRLNPSNKAPKLLHV